MKKSILIMLAIVIPLTAHSADHPMSVKRCQIVLEQLSKELYVPNKMMLKDAEAKTYDPYWGRLSQAFHTASEATLKALFTGDKQIIPSDIDDLWWMVKSGDVKVDNPTELFLNSLREFIMDNAAAFDGTENAPFKILQALDREDKIHSFEAGPNVATQTTDSALRKNEEMLLIQAIQESRGQRNKSNKWYDWFLNYFSPHYKRISSLINFNESIRRVMQLNSKADEPVSDILSRYATNLSADAKQKLQGLITDTGAKLGYSRELIVQVYGRELSQRTPVQIGDLRLRELGAKIKKVSVNSKEDNAVSEAEKDLDVIDGIMNSIYSNHTPNKRPTSDYHPVHLQIRYGQYRRETSELYNHYHEVGKKRPAQSDYTASASWTVEAVYHETKTRQVDVYEDQDDGNGGTKRVKTGTTPETYTETHTTSNPMSGNFTVHASYNEILDGNFIPSTDEVEPQLPSASSNAAYAAGTLISATNEGLSITGYDQKKTNWILQQAQKVRAVESPLRAKINEIITLVDKIADQYPGNIKLDSDWRAQLAQLDSLLTQLVNLYGSTLEKHKDLSASQVSQLWAQDNIGNFQERNNLLALRYRHLMNRIELFREEVGRKMTLGFEYSSPNYANQVATLEKIAKRNRIQQTVVGVGLAAALGYGGYWYQSDVNHQHRVEQAIKTLMR